MISTPYLDPTLFDDPRLDHNRVRRCWLCVGLKKVPTKNGKTKSVERTLYVNASRETVAKRVGRENLAFCGYRLSFVHEVSWEHYARSLPQEYVSWSKKTSS
jgi:hypothetical protein